VTTLAEHSQLVVEVGEELDPALVLGPGRDPRDDEADDCADACTCNGDETPTRAPV
jgi:hypothetical protein